MVELYPESCISVQLCIGRVLFGIDVNVSSLHMHAKTSFAHRLQTAKMVYSPLSAQNSDRTVKVFY